MIIDTIRIRIPKWSSILQEEDADFFSYKETNRTHVSLILARSLEDLVDAESPRNLLKFRVTCDLGTGDSLVSLHEIT